MTTTFPNPALLLSALDAIMGQVEIAIARTTGAASDAWDETYTALESARDQLRAAMRADDAAEVARQIEAERQARRFELMNVSRAA